MYKNLVGWLVRAYLLSGTIIEGVCVGVFERFIVFVNGIIVDSDENTEPFNALLLHKNRTLALFGIREENIEPVKSIYPIFEDKNVKFRFIRGGEGNGIFKSINEGAFVFTKCSVNALGGFIQEDSMPVCNIHKNQIEIMYY